jgi:Zn-dependent peptidase ImmA (M78 family)
MLDKMKLNGYAIECRRKLGEDVFSPIDIFTIAESIDNLTLVLYPLGERISGIYIKSGNDNIISINSSMTYGRQRFSLAHEFFHMFYESRSTVMVSNKTIGIGHQIEKEADQFASYFLAPSEALNLYMKRFNNQLSLDIIIATEQFFGFSHQAMLWRLVGDNIISKDQADSMKSNVISRAKLIGYNEKLYSTLSEEKRYMTYGSYIKNAQTLINMGKISEGKYEELLLEAFRSDIVYGDDIHGGDSLD